MFQSAYKAKFDAIPPDPEFRRQLEERIEDMKAPHMNKRKLPAAAAAIVIALLVLTTGALAASGTLGSVFNKIDKDLIYAEGHAPEINFGKLADMLETPVQSQTVTLENGSTVTVNLEEAYYTGTEYALGWAIQNDRTQMHFHEKEDCSFIGTGRAVKAMPVWVTDEAKAEFERRFAADGFACVSYAIARPEMELYSPDAAEEITTINDERGEYSAMVINVIDTMMDMWEEGNVVYLMDNGIYGVPPSLEGKDSLTATRFIYGWSYYYYQDETGGYVVTSKIQYFPVTFTVSRSGDINTAAGTFTAEFPKHTADITISMSPAQIDIKIDNHVDDSWFDIYRQNGAPYLGGDEPMNLSEDIIVWYDTLIDGQKIEGGWHSAGPFGGEYYFAPPEGAATLTICPVYANTLQHMDEAITIDLATMTIVK